MVPSFSIRVVPSRPRHVQGCSTDDEQLLNVGSQTVPCLREAGQGRARGVPRRSAPHSPLRHQTQTQLDTRVNWASVKMNRARCEDRGPLLPPSSKNLKKKTDRGTVAPSLSGTLRGTFLKTGRLLAQLEVDVGRVGLRHPHVGDRSWVVFF